MGLIFMVPGREVTLGVNGRAWITRDPDLLARLATRGQTPQTAIRVEVEECFVLLTRGPRMATPPLGQA